MKFNILILSIVLLVCSCKAQNPTNKNETNMSKPETTTHDISMYPEASDNQLRHIINLPKTDDDFGYKVEIYAGKMAEVDCNQSSLSASFTKETVSGWGYSYYNLDTNGQVISTRRMCPDNSKHQAFVQTPGEIIRYNSKLPIVIYTPKGYEVRYKIWSRNTTEKTAIVQ
ncbi:serine protease inhibitor ecotin [Tamlana sp. 2_MG-2023]|uniref:serine protease inhibitor ecotin n=1 Tax=unclassified Tamlana TaxID=2614803 RepID=UPI0026E22EBD|nr:MULTISPECIES: serine protease inhibitor ecotin [unclassified Tamlana]MDO6758802.1 serine protease inhibitor ecotin [Tamlana sp. 2_MG-2023]MDO6789501.1 serine protease inhibitor ecotin [Tamlana sp. 1_MG-2023]